MSLVDLFTKLVADDDVAIPVAAIQVLLGVIERSKAATMHGLDEELRSACTELLRADPAMLRGRTRISLASGSELFLRHVTRTFLEFEDFERCKAELLKRGETFLGRSRDSRERIAALGHAFVRDGSVVLVHGRSRVVIALLLRANETKQFKVLVTESTGFPSDFEDAGIATRVVSDSAVGYFMERVDCVLVGAEGVVENGGVINKIGTLVVATCAHARAKPVYVAAESYKFARVYPLNQRDLPDDIDDAAPTCDYTPPHYIKLLFTDLGVLTPAAVSDELIRLYS
ncbi:hypothetical protein CTAYLR_004587 [Chrysophaeum taylorii]|uniref:Translation initiation factor eIF2B subunit alpha n=1 Tax=Chrysophaeum taylorii TaxID=2483200 RepID=A0AAD7UDK2_9STRA|nr:hypothetical protein CTAYLR_004587 [Chrysophaeum taylorii]